MKPRRFKLHEIQSACHAFTLCALLIAGAACQPAPQAGLKSADVPAGFTFANIRGVQLSISIAPGKIPASGARLDIARGDGKLLYTGIANSQKPLSIVLGAPLKDAQLTATLRGGDGSQTSIPLPIIDGNAAGSFE